MTIGWTLYNQNAAAMYRFLDRETIEERRYRKSRKFFRSLKSKSLRQFVMTLKNAMIYDKNCNESNIQKNIANRLKIGVREYRKLRYLCLLEAEKVPKPLSNVLLVGSVVKNIPRSNHPKQGNTP